MRLTLLPLFVCSCMSSASAPTEDLTAPCTTSGDGSQGSQCCVWDAQACDHGLWCDWTGGPTENDGVCVPPSSAPSRFYEACALGANSCVIGGYCDGDCQVLCQPPGQNWCGTGTHCEPVSADGMVGYCVDH